MENQWKAKHPSLTILHFFETPGDALKCTTRQTRKQWRCHLMMFSFLWQKRWFCYFCLKVTIWIGFKWKTYFIQWTTWIKSQFHVTDRRQRLCETVAVVTSQHCRSKAFSKLWRQIGNSYSCLVVLFLRYTKQHHSLFLVARSSLKHPILNTTESDFDVECCESLFAALLSSWAWFLAKVN